jgi:hypothetical protein
MRRRKAFILNCFDNYILILYCESDTHVYAMLTTWDNEMVLKFLACWIARSQRRLCHLQWPGYAKRSIEVNTRSFSYLWVYFYGSIKGPWHKPDDLWRWSDSSSINLESFMIWPFTFGLLLTASVTKAPNILFILQEGKHQQNERKNC